MDSIPVIRRLGPSDKSSLFFDGAFFMKVSSLDYCLAFSEQFSSMQVEGGVMHEQKHQRQTFLART